MKLGYFLNPKNVPETLDIDGVLYEIVSEAPVSETTGKSALVLKRPKGKVYYVAFRHPDGTLSGPPVSV